MIEDLVKVLEELLAAAPGADAFHLRIQDDLATRDLSTEELDELFADFEGDFESAVATLGEGWGAPTYKGSIDRDDFPAWSVALLLAYWQHDGALAYISLRHDDDHEPMFLEVGALTEDEVATLSYTKS